MILNLIKFKFFFVVSFNDPSVMCSNRSEVTVVEFREYFETYMGFNLTHMCYISPLLPTRLIERGAWKLWMPEIAHFEFFNKFDRSLFMQLLIILKPFKIVLYLFSISIRKPDSHKNPFLSINNWNNKLKKELKKTMYILSLSSENLIILF